MVALPALPVSPGPQVVLLTAADLGVAACRLSTSARLAVLLPNHSTARRCLLGGWRKVARAKVGFSSGPGRRGPYRHMRQVARAEREAVQEREGGAAMAARALGVAAVALELPGEPAATAEKDS